ncbi:MAG: bifunctional DNA-formamidopyrimidine glycosylase/DNA-(apurinic or apyrimidinic site) lyase [Dehalococcoidia bacterium]
MPELPEVETIRRDLEPLLVGRTAVAVRIHAGAERLAVTHAPRELERELMGRRIEGLDRRGKYMLAALDDGRTWLLHLRMTGSLLSRPADAPAGRFERARVDFDDGSSLRLDDMRKFATWHLVDDPADAMPRMGPDALSRGFTVAWLREQLGRRTTSVKAALLDQRVAAGVGNIYADEACWIAQIDPRTEAGRLGPRRVARLHAAVLETLTAAIADRGSTFSDYRDGAGEPGLHQVNWHVFQREGEPCERCAREVSKIRIAGRGTRLCRGCQRR